MTARGPEYGATTFHVEDRERSNIEAALHHKNKKVLDIIYSKKWQ